MRNGSSDMRTESQCLRTTAHHFLRVQLIGLIEDPRAASVRRGDTPVDMAPACSGI